MKITNNTTDIRTTWTGVDIQPGDTQDVVVTDAEAKWLSLRGCTVGDAKPEPAPKRVTRKRSSSRVFGG